MAHACTISRKMAGPNGRRIASRADETIIRKLLERCRNGEQNAWVEFVRRFNPVIMAVTINAVRHWTFPTSALVDDLVQDIYLKLCTDNFRILKRFNYRHENAFIEFLKVVAANAVHDHFRSFQSQKRGNGKMEENIEDPGLQHRIFRNEL